MLIDCTGIKAEEGDQLPYNICVGCKEKLFSSWSFRVLALNSDSKLREDCNDKVFAEVEVKDEPIIRQYDDGNKSITAVNDNSYEMGNDTENLHAQHSHDISKGTVRDQELQSTQKRYPGLVLVISNDLINQALLKAGFQTNLSKYPDKSLHDDNSNTEKCSPEYQQLDGNKKQIETSQAVEDVVCKTDDTVSVKSGYVDGTSHFDDNSVVIPNIEPISSNENDNLSLDESDKEQNGNDAMPNSYNHLAYPEGKVKFRCKICKKPFKNDYQLEKHQAVHQNDEYICDICGESFETFWKKRNHRAIHRGQFHACHLCDRTFKRKKSLEEHLERHNQKKERDYVCELCGKILQGLSSLRGHFACHMSEKRFLCVTCGKGFPTQMRLSIHKRRHSTLKQFLCKECGKAFLGPSELRRHMLMHTGERTHPCKICGKLFGDSSTIIRHMLIHTGETPFECTKCPYKCRTCLKTGTNYFNLFNYFEDSKALSEMLMECVTIKVKEGDGLPYHICNNCRNKLNSSWAFRTLVLRSEVKLHSNIESHLLSDNAVFEEEASVCRDEKVEYNSNVVESANNNNYNRRVEQSKCLLSETLDFIPSLSHTDKNVTQKNKAVIESIYKNNCVTIKDTIKEHCEEKIVGTSYNLDCTKDNFDQFSKHKSIGTRALYLKKELSNTDDKILESQNVEDCQTSETTIESDTKSTPPSKLVKRQRQRYQMNHKNEKFSSKLCKTSVFAKEAVTNKSVIAAAADPSNTSKETSIVRDLELENMKKQYPGMILVISNTLVNQGFQTGSSECLDKDNSKIMKNSVEYQQSGVEANYLDNKKQVEILQTKDDIVRESDDSFIKSEYVDNLNASADVFIVDDESVSSNDKNNLLLHELDTKQGGDDAAQQEVEISKVHCKECDKFFSRSYYNRVHLYYHQGKLKYACKVCNESFKNDYQLEKHKAVHQNEKHVCEICGKSFVTYSMKRVHRRVHKNESHACHLCDRTFKRKKILDDHLEQHNRKRTRDYVCELCGKLFQGLRSLRGHSACHITEKSFLCVTCGKGFPTQMRLSMHQRRHSTLKRFSCKQCGKAFLGPSELKRHMLMHTGERTHPCKICGKLFGDRSTIIRHMLIHTGETPFECAKCPYKCRYKQQFDKHMKKHK
ncbi:hypothetical protein Trydic_g13054 [Trypoxylus dichotomus]